MTLLDLQRRMGGAILRRPAASGSMDPETDTSFIKPNAVLSSTERLEIYSRSYWARVLDSLRDDFPGLRAVLGEDAFQTLSEAYLDECPSHSFTLRDLGSRLREWLVRNPAFAGSCPALALDIVCLEWAHIEAFDAEERKPVGPEDLLELSGEMRFDLQPCISLLELRYPADDIRLRLARRKNPLTPRPCRVPRSGRFLLAVHRVDTTVHYRRLEPDEFQILLGIREGKSLADAIDCAAAQTALAIFEFESRIEGWFAAWSRLGWLCSLRLPISESGPR